LAYFKRSIISSHVTTWNLNHSVHMLPLILHSMKTHM
jgi:hypothetical protein